MGQGPRTPTVSSPTLAALMSSSARHSAMVLMFRKAASRAPVHSSQMAWGAGGLVSLGRRTPYTRQAVRAPDSRRPKTRPSGNETGVPRPGPWMENEQRQGGTHRTEGVLDARLLLNSTGRQRARTSTFSENVIN